MPDASDDRDLLSAFVTTKDEGAFGEIVRRHQSMMHAVAFRICGNPHDAKDATQRALIAFARRSGEIRAEPSVGPWLHRATTLEALAVRRQRIKRSIREHEAMEQQHLQTESMPPEIAAKLDEAINGLSSKDRAVIVLHYLENLTFRSIAKKHGGTEAAWQKRGVRALEKLSGTLRRRGVVATGTALGTWLATSPAEAAVLHPGAIKVMLNEALRQPLTTGLGSQSSATLLLIMKLKTTLALCFVGGAIFSYGWNENKGSAAREDEELAVQRSHSPRIQRDERNAPTFNLEQVANAFRRFDLLEKVSASEQSRLRALMFSVPESYLDSVLDLFDDLENPDRFSEIAACFYARWAEIDPEAAWRAALKEDMYLTEARRGVMLTWLNKDPEAAVGAMMENRSDEEDLLVLHEFAMMKVQHDPAGAAHLVDMLAEKWPRADRRLFEDVARTWAYNDPSPAGAWVESYWNRDIRNEFLKRFAWRVGSKNYRDGFEMANRIDDPELRQRARCSALEWWARPWAVIPGAGDPDLNFSSGFPDDWNLLEMTAYTSGLMRNNSKNYPDVLAVAKNEAERQAVYRGAIDGAVYSKPEAVIHAVENVDQNFISTDAGRDAVSAFITRWAERDPKAATAWLEAQAENPKTALMRQSLSSQPNKQSNVSE